MDNKIDLGIGVPEKIKTADSAVLEKQNTQALALYDFSPEDEAIAQSEGIVAAGTPRDMIRTVIEADAIRIASLPCLWLYAAQDQEPTSIR